MTTESEPQVLIVDDQLSNRRVLSGMLTHLGCVCEVAEGAEVALNLVSTGRRFDIIFMDMQMPQLDGFEATRRMRSLTQSAERHQVILAVSAAPSEEHRKRAFAAGVDDFLEKPVGLRALRKALTLWCENAPDEPSAPLPPRSPRLPKALAIDLSKVADSPEFESHVLADMASLGGDAGDRLPGEVVGLLLAQIPYKRKAVQDALSWGDAESLRQAAHSLGGGARNVGAKQVAALCDELQRHLERDSSRESVIGTRPVVDALLAALDRAVLVLGAAIGERA